MRHFFILTQASSIVLACALAGIGPSADAGSDRSGYSANDLIDLGRAVSDYATVNSIMAPPVPVATGGRQAVTLYVTNSGISQYRDSGVLKTGDDFSFTKSQVFSSIPKAGQIAVVMPPHQEFERMSDREFTAGIAKTLTNRIDGGLGVTKAYEIQLIEHMGPQTYLLSPTHEKDVQRFNKCAYEAIGLANNHLTKDKGVETRCVAVVGSHGTNTLVGNVESWKPYIRGITFVDGRATLPGVIKAIEVVGAENVRIFNTKGDWSDDSNSIGAFKAVKTLKEKFPSLQVGLLDPVDRPNIPWSPGALGGGAHCAAMNDNARFRVSFLKSDGTLRPPMDITGRQIHAMSDQVFPRPTPVFTRPGTPVQTSMPISTGSSIGGGQSTWRPREYWTRAEAPKLWTEATTMASMAGRSDPGRAIVVVDNLDLFEAMRKQLPPQTSVTRMNTFDWLTVGRQKAIDTHTDVVLGVGPVKPPTAKLDWRPDSVPKFRKPELDTLTLDPPYSFGRAMVPPKTALPGLPSAPPSLTSPSMSSLSARSYYAPLASGLTGRDPFPTSTKITLPGLPSAPPSLVSPTWSARSYYTPLPSGLTGPGAMRMYTPPMPAPIVTSPPRSR